MVRSELAASLAELNPQLDRETAERLVALIFETISAHLVAGGRVELRGFGAFSARARDARIGRNPRNGEPVDVPAKRVPFFKPGKEMRQRLVAE
jgi:integration host factor beta subunit